MRACVLVYMRRVISVFVYFIVVEELVISVL